ncbi:MAG: hypothetical protein NTW11_03245 [Candidatus Staskawiczbacteria bacterium]|nr:hypothetical protein [Candidatus Staskawiczbacteria bacterium]
MILLVHILFGVAVGSLVNNIPLAIVFAFLSHYFLDLFPHIEYNIEIRNKKQWPSSAKAMAGRQGKLWSITKIAIDFLTGVLFIFLFSKNQPINYICAFFAILPDGITVLTNHFPSKFLKPHNKFHQEKIHFLKYKKISNFWRILSQVLAVVISILLLKF